MSVINELLNTKSIDQAQRKVTVLDIEEIYPNPLNKAPMINIDELSKIIDENGLQTPLLVYKQENHQYVIINGERRYRALKRLGKGSAPVIIVDKPKTLLDERLLILDANVQRDESKEYKKQRAKEYEELYYKLKEDEAIPTGLLKIDWIGMHMNVSGRTIQRYLEDKDSSYVKPKKEKLHEYKDLEDHIQSKLQTKVSFKTNSFQVKFSNINDLNRILEILNLGNIVNE